MKRSSGIIKYLFFVIQASAALFVLGCASSVKAPKPVQRSRAIDWQGAAYGTEIPEWAKIIMQGDEVDKIQTMPEFSKKYVKFASVRGQDIELLKTWASADAADAISRSISQNVTSELGTALNGNKDDAASVKMAEQAIGIFSTNKISGFEKSREFWVKMQHDSGKTEFEYVVLYSISKDTFHDQIDQALGKIAAKTEQEKQALSRINELIKVSALKATAVTEQM